MASKDVQRLIGALLLNVTPRSTEHNSAHNGLRYAKTLGYVHLPFSACLSFVYFAYSIIRQLGMLMVDASRHSLNMHAATIAITRGLSILGVSIRHIVSVCSSTNMVWTAALRGIAGVHSNWRPFARCQEQGDTVSNESAAIGFELPIARPIGAQFPHPTAINARLHAAPKASNIFHTQNGWCRSLGSHQTSFSGSWLGRRMQLATATTLALFYPSLLIGAIANG